MPPRKQTPVARAEEEVEEEDEDMEEEPGKDMDGEEEEEDDEEEEEDEEQDDDEDDESGTGREDVVDDLKYDLYNLTAFDYHGLRLPEGSEKREAALREKATRATQLLVKRIFGLPVEDDATGPLATLPNDDVTRLPRAQRVPDPEPQTKWEKFAIEKGIQKTKRERMVFDEQTQEYKPRYGYKSIKGGIEDQPIVEIKKGQDPFADPWEAARADKKARVDKNLKNQAKNQDRAAGGRGGKAGKAGAGLEVYGASSSLVCCVTVVRSPLSPHHPPSVSFPPKTQQTPAESRAFLWACRVAGLRSSAGARASSRLCSWRSTRRRPWAASTSSAAASPR